jgi:hypothetical protein
LTLGPLAGARFGLGLGLANQEDGLFRPSVGRACQPRDPMRPVSFAFDLERTGFGRDRLSHGRILSLFFGAKV